jgi:Zn-dependent oligopeptidase
MIWFALGLVIGIAAGYYAHYKWGATLAADVTKLKAKL